MESRCGGAVVSLLKSSAISLTVPSHHLKDIIMLSTKAGKRTTYGKSEVQFTHILLDGIFCETLKWHDLSSYLLLFGFDGFG